MGSLASIQLLVLDVDGVLTDGSLYYGETGEMLKCFNAKDGAGIALWNSSGRQTAIITGRNTPAVAKRVEDLGIQHLYMGIHDKLPILQKIWDTTGIKPEQTAYIGDDLPDMAPMQACGAAFAPADAARDLHIDAITILSKPGGRGAVREAIELILEAAGEWDTVRASWLS